MQNSWHRVASLNDYLEDIWNIFLSWEEVSHEERGKYVLMEEKKLMNISISLHLIDLAVETRKLNKCFFLHSIYERRVNLAFTTV